MIVKRIIVSCLQYRGLIKAITMREIYSRYAASLLGPLWIIFPPLFSVFVYTFVFARIMNAKVGGIDSPYAYTIFVCSGTVAWGAFVETIQRAKDVFLANSNLIKKASFPRIVLFVPIVLSALLNAAVVLFVNVLLVMVLGFSISWTSFVFYIPAVLLMMFLGLALGSVLSITNVFLRDAGQFTGTLCQILYWGTPIVYPLSVIPEKWHAILSLNPVLPIIDLARYAFLDAPMNFWMLLYPFGLGVVAAYLAVIMYRRSRSDILDHI